MAEVLQQLVNGISLGSIYALIALGYTMVYGVLKLINFAHGDVYMVGAFAGFFAATAFGWGFLPALCFAMLVAALFGLVIERVAYRPLRNAPRIAALITAIGVSLLLENLGILILRPDPRAFPELIRLETYQVGPLIVNNRQLVIIATSVVLMMLLQFIVTRTRMGKAMRAVAEDTEASRLMGINVDRVIAFTFVLGSALAAAAGVLVGIYYTRIDPLMGFMPGLKAFVAAVLGGIGLIPGAMLGGLAIGVAEVLVVAFISSSWKDAVAFAILIMILLLKPTGILGKTAEEKA
ncbi:MAG: branched-chain amino acid ABC transporter permease [Limnochordales bacterium]|nr:branched-chain amino acid ABC transporter permease [Limnochordales bacterium]